MKVNQTHNNYGGIGFLGALCLLFVALKLTGVIAWSWWAVTAPLWVPWILAAVIFSGALLYILGRDAYKSWSKKK